MYNRLVVEAVLWIVHTDSLWRDLSAELGKWTTVSKRFRDCVKADVFQKLFEAVGHGGGWVAASGEGKHSR